MLQDYVTRQAENRPDAPALAMGGTSMNYGDLEAASNRVAQMLKAHNIRSGDRVCLLLPKAPTTIVSMIGVLKAGGVYVPIDTSSPGARVHKIVEAADPSAILTTRSTASLLDELIGLGLGADIKLGTMDVEHVEGNRFFTSFSGAHMNSLDPAPLVAGGSTDDPAHILFTSGSTGVPKGVVITHANVIPFVEWATDYFGTRGSDRISGHPPLHFDLSTFDIFGSFLAGAELHLVPPSLNLSAHGLAGFIRVTELTQWFSVPSVMTYMTKFDVVRQDDFPSLERVLWCGEVLPTPILAHWMRRLPHATFTNLYGPTEATIASSYHTVSRLPPTDTEPVPIGVPCAGETLHILDEDLEAVPTGEIGGLYISGVGLSPGYWRDDEKTAAAFLDWPTQLGPAARLYKTGDLARIDVDGLVHFLGRADSQIKSRGHRIELGEIEGATNALPAVKECAIVAVETGGFEGTSIGCAFVPADSTITPVNIREALRTQLPSYMIPSRWLVRDELPKNVNGKIDRRLLRETFAELGESEPAHASA